MIDKIVFGILAVYGLLLIVMATSVLNFDLKFASIGATAGAILFVLSCWVIKNGED
jgi:hypothetical protein